MARGAGMICLLTAGLLLLGGRLSYWQAWLFGGVNLALVALVAVWLADESELIRERMKPGPATKHWDRVLMALFFPLAMCVPVLAALDAGRFGWTGRLSPAVCVAGYPVYVLSAYLHLAAIRTNRFYTSTVSVEPETGQRVIDSGPYRVVRHPGYTGIIFMEGAIAVVLGSWWALVPAGLVAAVLIVRTGLEDGALKAELPGYETYARRVRYRLLPGLW
jgi:protein-S-isoprenylcysteine O-methyltransferase Ste14